MSTFTRSAEALRNEVNKLKEKEMQITKKKQERKASALSLTKSDPNDEQITKEETGLVMEGVGQLGGLNRRDLSLSKKSAHLSQSKLSSKRKLRKSKSEKDDKKSKFKSDDDDDDDDGDGDDDDGDGDDDDDDDGDDSDDMFANVEIDMNALNGNDSDNSEWESSDEDIGDEDVVEGYRAGQIVNDTLKRLDEIITMSGQKLENINENDVIQACNDIQSAYNKNPTLLAEFLKRAVIPVMELLQCENVGVLKIVIQTIQLFMSDHKSGKKFLESLCLVQFVPTVGDLATHKNHEISSLATPLLLQLCDKNKASPFSRKMFIASGGLSILSKCLKKKYTRENKNLIFAAIDCIDMLFFSKLHNKRDLARLFTKAEIMPILMRRFMDTTNDLDDVDKAIDYGEKISNFFLRIVEYGDRVVKQMISGSQKIEDIIIMNEGISQISLNNENNEIALNQSIQDSNVVLWMSY